MKICVVYNTCGISDKDNTDYYISALESILHQHQDDFEMDVLISSCLNKAEHRRKIGGRFTDSIQYCYIDERLTVNQTFNKSCREYVERNGRPDGFLYVDSGCRFTDRDTIAKMVDVFSDGEFGMVTAPTDNDTAFDSCFGFDIAPPNFNVPVGKACNLHVQIFSSRIYDNFDNRIINDIHGSFCTESVFSFLNACLNLKWRILNNTVVEHNRSMDGASSGFGHHGWEHILPYCKKTIQQIITDPEGTDCGFGYEECNSRKMHNPQCFDDNGFAIYPERLKKFILNNVFLSPDEFDYDNIKYNYIGK